MAMKIDSSAAYIGTVIKALTLLRTAFVFAFVLRRSDWKRVLGGAGVVRRRRLGSVSPWQFQHSPQNRDVRCRDMRTRHDFILTHSSSSSSLSSSLLSTSSVSSNWACFFGTSGNPQNSLPLSDLVGFFLTCELWLDPLRFNVLAISFRPAGCILCAEPGPFVHCTEGAGEGSLRNDPTTASRLLLGFLRSSRAS
jgi:hypothetical protein